MGVVSILHLRFRSFAAAYTEKSVPDGRYALGRRSELGMDTNTEGRSVWQVEKRRVNEAFRSCCYCSGRSETD